MLRSVYLIAISINKASLLSVESSQLLHFSHVARYILGGGKNCFGGREFGGRVNQPGTQPAAIRGQGIFGGGREHNWRAQLNSSLLKHGSWMAKKDTGK